MLSAAALLRFVPFLFHPHFGSFFPSTSSLSRASRSLLFSLSSPYLSHEHLLFCSELLLHGFFFRFAKDFIAIHLLCSSVSQGIVLVCLLVFQSLPYFFLVVSLYISCADFILITPL